MTFSILIPIFNVEKYLSRCLDSILRQSDLNDINLDIILIDDESTDKSLDIAIEYAKKDERIFVLSKKNAGLSTARNAALELTKGTKLRAYLDKKIKEDFFIKSYKNTHSFDKSDIKKLSKDDIDKVFTRLDERVYKTELSDINDFIIQDLSPDTYVHFLDSDDYLDKKCINTCLRQLKDGLDLYLHNVSSVDEEDELIKEKIYLKANLSFGSYAKGLDFLQDNKLYDFYFAYHGAFRASLLNSYKLRFIKHIYHEDHDFAIILFASSSKIFVDDEVLLYYRSRSGSIISSMQDDTYPKKLPFYLETLKASFKSYKKLRKYYKAYCFCKSALFVFNFYEEKINLEPSFKSYKSFFTKAILNLIQIFKISLKVDPLNIKKMLQAFSFKKRTILFFFLKDLHRQPKKFKYIKNLKYLLKDKI